ncbi:MAG: transposase [Beijerinckiaceae bacterium]
MFSALVLVQHGANGAPSSEAIVRTLASLVPAAIEGIVRDVALAAQSQSDDLSRIADHAGCEHVQADADKLIAAGLATLKEPRVLVLRAGRVPEHGFIGELADFAAYRAQQAGVLLDAPDSFLTRVVPRLARASGVVAPRDALTGARPDVIAMAKKLPSPVVFRSRAIGDD